MDKFQNKYRIPSARLQGWDYSQNGVYFITICTAGRECLFGDIIVETYDVETHGRASLRLSAIGQIVNHEWDKSFEIRSELFCDAFIIMPNHIHAILRIENINLDSHGLHGLHVETHGLDGLHVETHGLDGLHVETHGRASLQTQQIIQRTGVAYRSPKSISSFVAGFKSSATKHINELRGTPKLPVWQPRFHDHIIRNDAEYQRIANYIDTNPENWETDNFFKSKES